MIKQIKLFLGCILLFGISPQKISAESMSENPIVNISTSEIDPLNTIKTALINERAKQNRLQLDDIDIENSTIVINTFDRTKVGFNLADVNITLSYKEKEKNGRRQRKSTPVNSIAYSFSDTILIHIQADDKPQLLLNEEQITITENDFFDPMQYISYLYDQSRSLPMLEIDNPVDTSKLGQYTVTYTASNLMGKSTVAKLTVNIEPAKPPFSINIDEIQFADDHLINGMLDAINAVRAEHGLYAYELADDTGQTVAALRAYETNYLLAHTRPDGRAYATAFDDINAPHGAVYEILVAYGSSIQSNLNWWLNEPGHARIVLGTIGTQIAIGYQNGIWVAEIY